MNHKSKNIICSCIYTHPASDPDKLTQYLEQILDKLSRENKLVFLLYINLLNYDTHNATNEFLNSMYTNFFLLSFILQPTRVTEASATLIDNIYANCINHSSISGNIVTNISDHFPQFLIINDPGIDYKTLNYWVYDYSNVDKSSLLEEYSNID